MPISRNLQKVQLQGDETYALAIHCRIKRHVRTGHGLPTNRGLIAFVGAFLVGTLVAGMGTVVVWLLFVVL
ncbi:MAG: hypothetical protein ACTIJQ_14680 [Alcaligenes sp.]